MGSIRYVPKHDELRLGEDLIAALGNPAKVNIKAYMGGFIITAEGHPDLDPLDKLGTVRKFGRLRMSMEHASQLGISEGYYKYTLVQAGQVLAMPDNRTRE